MSSDYTPDTRLAHNAKSRAAKEQSVFRGPANYLLYAEVRYNKINTSDMDQVIPRRIFDISVSLVFRWIT